MKQTLQTFKFALAALSLSLVAATSAHAVNIATALNGTTVTTTVTAGAGDTFQMGSGESFTIGSSGTVDVQSGSNNTNMAIGQSSTSSVTVNGGTLNLNGPASLLFGNGASGNGTITLLDGSLNINPGASLFVGRQGGTALITVSGGSASFGILPSFDVVAGGLTGIGSLDFTTGSTGSLTITGASLAYYEGLYSGDDLTFEGVNGGTFGDIFTVSGETISLVPEPSSSALLGLGGLALILHRRK
jgi:hypothetical protein